MHIHFMNRDRSECTDTISRISAGSKSHFGTFVYIKIIQHLSAFFIKSSSKSFPTCPKIIHYDQIVIKPKLKQKNPEILSSQGFQGF